MSCTQLSEPPHADIAGYDDGQPQAAVPDPFIVEGAQRSSFAYSSAAPVRHLSGVSARRTVVRPTLHHFGLTTANLEAMVDWYAKVLGMETNHRSRANTEGQSVGRWRIAWVSNDDANHRIAIMALSGLTEDGQRSRHTGLHHVAFEYPTLDDLLGTYARLKTLGIAPVRAADHGTTTSFYYEDPDRNSIELMVDNFGDGEESSAFMRLSPEFAANPMGTDVDPEQMLAARAAGMSVAELHERAYAGKLCSANGFYRHWLLTAADQGRAG